MSIESILQTAKESSLRLNYLWEFPSGRWQAGFRDDEKACHWGYAKGATALEALERALSDTKNRTPEFYKPKVSLEEF